MRDAEGTAALVGRAKAGEVAAFEQLVRLHFRAAHAVGLAVLRNAADAEDVAQESFVVAFERLNSCHSPERFAGWLLQIVRNRALNLLKSKRAASSLAERMGTAREQEKSGLDGLDERDRLLAALARISPVQREVVLLHDLDGWTHAEIALALGISEVMSRQHLFVARKSMAESLDEGKQEVAHGVRGA